MHRRHDKNPETVLPLEGYLVLERFPRTLAEELDSLRADCRMPETRVREVMIGVLTGLWALRSVGVSHGDIKPENVVVDGPRVALIDLGSSADTHGFPTKTSSYPTTVFFCPPEKAENMTPTFKGDAYQAGLVLLSCLLGCQSVTLPFLMKIMSATSNGSAASLAPTSTPAVLQRVLSGLLERDPERHLDVYNALQMMIHFLVMDGREESSHGPTVSRTHDEGLSTFKNRTPWSTALSSQLRADPLRMDSVVSVLRACPELTDEEKSHLSDSIGEGPMGCWQELWRRLRRTTENSSDGHEWDAMAILPDVYRCLELGQWSQALAAVARESGGMSPEEDGIRSIVQALCRLQLSGGARKTVSVDVLSQLRDPLKGSEGLPGKWEVVRLYTLSLLCTAAGLCVEGCAYGVGCLSWDGRVLSVVSRKWLNEMEWTVQQHGAVLAQSLAEDPREARADA